MVDGPWARAERTLNISSMVVTLDVSKLSGWLNPLALLNMKLMSVTLDVSRVSGWLNSGAPCRAEMRAYEAGRGAGLEAGEGVEREHGRPIAQTVCTRHAGRAHPKHRAHVRDAGRIETQRLVERLCTLASRKGGTRCWARCGSYRRARRGAYTNLRGVRTGRRDGSGAATA